MKTDNLHPYYRERKPQVLASFIENLNLVRAEFDRIVGEALTDRFFEKFVDEFDHVYLTIPYVGGAAGRMTPFFELGAGVIAVGRVLRVEGYDTSAISTLMKSTFLAKLSSLPVNERHELGRTFMSKENQTYLKAESEKSTLRTNAGDFVYHVVEPDAGSAAKDFEFGINYSECGFCKLCKSTGDEDLLPNFCAVDAEFYALRGIDLIRTTTLASGNSQCDFRFRAMPELYENKNTD